MKWLALLALLVGCGNDMVTEEGIPNGWSAEEAEVFDKASQQLCDALPEHCGTTTLRNMLRLSGADYDVLGWAYPEGYATIMVDMIEKDPFEDKTELLRYVFLHEMLHLAGGWEHPDESLACVLCGFEPGRTVTKVDVDHVRGKKL